MCLPGEIGAGHPHRELPPGPVLQDSGEPQAGDHCSQRWVLEDWRLNYDQSVWTLHKYMVLKCCDNCKYIYFWVSFTSCRSLLGLFQLGLFWVSILKLRGHFEKW